MKYLGFDDMESLDEAISCGGIDMRQGDQWVYMDVDGWGYRVYEHDVDRPYMDNHYATLQKMIDNYVFPDGTPLKGLVDGTIPETGDEQTNIEND